MKRITKVEILTKNYVITDKKEVLLIGVDKKDRINVKYFNLPEMELIESLEDWKELDKNFRQQLKDEKQAKNPKKTTLNTKKNPEETKS